MLVLKNEQRKVKLEALELPNEKADTIVQGIITVLEYNLWKSIKIIIVDNTSINTWNKLD